MKRKHILTILCVILAIIIVKITFNLSLSGKKYSIVGSWTVHSVIADLPGGEKYEITDGEKYNKDDGKSDILFAKAENGNYYGYEKGDDTNRLYIYDSENRKLGECDTDIDAVRITCYQNKAGLLSKATSGYNYYLVDMETGEEELLLENIQLKDIYGFHVKDNLIAYTKTDDETVFISDGKESAMNELETYLLCIKDSDTVILYDFISTNLRYVELTEYNIQTGKEKHLRYTYLPSAVACVSDDGRYLVALEMIMPSGQSNPVLIDLKLPRTHKTYVNGLDFSYIEWNSQSNS
jgi:hypothetical protein